MAVLFGLAAGQAHALALGPIHVQSAIGEPLRAEVEVPNITFGEAENLRLNIASADAFQQAGIAYNQVLADVRASLQRRADGRYVVRLIGTRPLSDPFIDLLLEANWSAGRIVRDYTLLLDPPSSHATTAIAAPVPLAPQVGSAPTAPASPRATTATSPPAVSVARAPESPAVRPVPAVGSDRQVTVQRGDTAGEIARVHKAAGISLDQMLVALLRANPDAFIDGNVNRMRSGAVLNLPSAVEAGTVAAPEARRTITAQSRDFGEYRRRLAENAPTSRVAEAGRGALGRLQANVEDRNTAAPTADRLTIAQSATTKNTEAAVLKAREAQDSQARIAELSRNIDDLNKLLPTDSRGAAASATPAAPVVGSTPPVAAAASPAARSGTGLQGGPAERKVIGMARDKSLLVAALGAALVLILLMAYRIRERRKSTGPTSAGEAPLSHDAPLLDGLLAARVHGTLVPGQDAVGAGEESPDAIKLSLARELYALGDAEGARSLAEEVAAESAGDLQAEAVQLLGRLR